MLNKLQNIEFNIPRWGVLIIDMTLSLFSILIAYQLRFNFDIPDKFIDQFVFVLPFVLSIRGIAFLLTKSFAGIIVHTSVQDAMRIFYTIALSGVVYYLANFISFQVNQVNFIPVSIIIIDAICAMFFLMAFRVAMKALYMEFLSMRKEKVNVVIYGCGQEAIITKKTMDRDLQYNYNVVAFIDDNKKHSKQKIENIKIHHSSDDIESILAESKVDLFIFSNSEIEDTTKRRFVDACLAEDIKVLNVPPMSKWINGELSLNQIKRVKIEDLLGREEIDLDSSSIKKELLGKVVLVTGAAGSIGSEIVRQILPFQPKKVILLDQAESPLYELDIELGESKTQTNYEIVIGNVKDKERMNNLFNTFKPEVVFHAAAYKHVPMMENNPSEAINTNVNGTKVIADLSVQYGITKFVLVSTDKAVNPTNVMGASKRLAEIYVQSLNNDASNQQTRFVTTRFGNVLGSNGSVIPLFRKQILAGGPVTVTDPEITRFFMTIPEACQLVLEAGAMGQGGEIFIFDMGESIKIVDLAKKMIKLYGLELGKDIQLVFTGLRPGEKLYEELLNNAENTLPTHHKKIMIAKVREYEYNDVNAHMQELISLFEIQNNEAIVMKMKAMVPEYKSNNSTYEKLDIQQSAN